MVKKFVTRRVEIEAMRYTDESVEALREWTWDHEKNEARFKEVDRFQAEDFNEFPGRIFDILHDSWIKVSKGQWIVRGAKGEFYPCDDETFHWKYEQITDPDFSLTGTLEYRDGEVTAEGFILTEGQKKELEALAQEDDE